jgi:hypothetical protein
MVRCGAVLVRAGQALLGIAAALARVAADPALLASGALAPVTAARVEVGLAAAALGPSGAAVVAARLEALGGGLCLAAAGYRVADEGARAAARQVDLAAGTAVGRVLAPLALPLAAAGVTVAAGASRRTGASGPATPAVRASLVVLSDRLGRHAATVEHAAAGLPGAVHGLLGAVPGTGAAWAVAAGSPWPGGRVPDAAAMAAAVGRPFPWLRERVPVVVDAGRPVRATAPAGLADVLSRVAGCSSDAGAPAGTVRVDAVRHADGSRAWVVAVPGTRTWSPTPGADPFDLTGNVHAMAGRRTAGGEVVVSALRAAGARPGEPVLLAGHSQGGMVVAGLAADPRFRAEFAVTHVVTAGAPVAAAPVPSPVRVLSLEHVEDLVPRLDGAPNRRPAHWVTVSRPLAPQGSVVGLGTAHGAQTYAGTAALVDASADPSLRRWREGLEVFLDRPGATATALSVRGRRAVPS